jgi:hypothetical protein
MKARFMLMLGAAALLGACDDDDDDNGPDGSALIRVVHGISDAPALAVEIDGELAQTLDFGDVTPATPASYFEVHDDDHLVELLDEETSVLAETIDPDDGEFVTFIALGRLDDESVEALVLEDDNSAPAAGNVRVRVVHAASTLEPVDVYVAPTGSPLPSAATLADLEFRESDYLQEAAAGSYRVCVVPGGADPDDGCLIDETTPVIPAGTVATAIALDPVTDGDAPEVRLLVDRVDADVLTATGAR